MQIKLKAQNLEKNIDRVYDIFVGKTLFGGYYVLTAWGRRGKKMRIKDYLFDTEDHALKFKNTIIKRRLTAQKRIGIAYERVS
jgi:predicted DNA-binding WGR domain protein